MHNGGPVMDDKTKVPIGWMFLILSASGTALMLAMSMAFWLGKVEIRVSAAEVNASESSQYMRSIDQRLSHIEGALGVGKK